MWPGDSSFISTIGSFAFPILSVFEVVKYYQQNVITHRNSKVNTNQISLRASHYLSNYWFRHNVHCTQVKPKAYQRSQDCLQEIELRHMSILRSMHHSSDCSIPQLWKHYLLSNNLSCKRETRLSRSSFPAHRSMTHNRTSVAKEIERERPDFPPSLRWYSTKLAGYISNHLHFTLLFSRPAYSRTSVTKEIKRDQASPLPYGDIQQKWRATFQIPTIPAIIFPPSL